jgi:hypothetical protein
VLSSNSKDEGELLVIKVDSTFRVAYSLLYWMSTSDLWTTMWLALFKNELFKTRLWSPDCEVSKGCGIGWLVLVLLKLLLVTVFSI